jgi:PKD repeat protein
MNKFVYKIVLGMFCLAMGSGAVAQNLSDEEIGFDVKKTTASLKKSGLKDQQIQSQLTADRQMYMRRYKVMNIEKEDYLNKISNNQNMTNAVVPIATQEQLALEKATLIEFYNATNGNSWTNTVNNKSAWPVNDPNSVVTSWDSINNTGWYGVTVVNGHVVSLNFSSNNLDNKNVLFPNLSNLTYLETLNLSNEPLKGALDNFKYLTSLKTIFIRKTQFTGSLSDLSLLINLESLYLIDNPNFSGGIPIAFYDFVNLKNLILEGINLTGGISPLIGNLKNLETLTIRDNIKGTFPIELCDLIKLKTLVFSSPYFETEYPSVINKLINLETLELNGRGLNNTKLKFPIEVFDLLKIRILDLDNFSMGGNIPSKIGKLKNLTYLYLTDDGFYGEIPPEFLDLLALKELWLPLNQFRFIDLARLFPTFKSQLNVFYYSGQSQIDTEKTVNGVLGQSITLTMCEDERYIPNVDTYQWYKGVALNGVKIENANSRSYTINNLSNTDAGDYYCVSSHPQMTNAAINFENFFLLRKPIHLKIQNCPTQTGTIQTGPSAPTINTPTSFTLSTTVTGVINYKWTFYGADNITELSTQTTPTATQTYNAAGNYKVKLEAKDANGCPITVTDIIVDVIWNCPTQTGTIQTGPSAPTINTPTNFTLSTTVTGVINYKWTFYGADNITELSTQTTTTATQTYTAAGNYKVKLEAKDANGCPITVTDIIVNIIDCTFKEGYVISINDGYEDIQDVPINTAIPITFVNGYNFPGQLTYKWKILDPNGKLIIEGVESGYTVTPTLLGNYSVEVLVKDEEGCIAKFSKIMHVVDICTFTVNARKGSIRVDENDYGSILQVNTNQIVNLNLYLYQNLVVAKSYDWKLYNPNEVEIASGNQSIFPINLTSGGYYKVTLEMTDSNGCKSQYTRIINCIINNSCTLTNSKSLLVQDLFLKLVKHILVRTVNNEPDATITGSSPSQLIALKPYITNGIADKIYNFVSARNQRGGVTSIQFSFSPNSDYDVKMFFKYGIYTTKGDFEEELNEFIYVNFSQYINADNLLISCYSSEQSRKKPAQKIVEPTENDCDLRSDIRFVDFCPNGCNPITGTIIVQSSVVPVVIPPGDDTPQDLMCLNIEISGGATGVQGSYQDCEGVTQYYDVSPNQTLYICQLTAYKEGYSLCSSTVPVIDPASRTAPKQQNKKTLKK